MRRWTLLKTASFSFSGNLVLVWGRNTLPRESDFHPRTSVGTPSHGVIGIAGFFGEFTTISCRTDLGRSSSQMGSSESIPLARSCLIALFWMSMCWVRLLSDMMGEDEELLVCDI